MVRREGRNHVARRFFDAPQKPSAALINIQYPLFTVPSAGYFQIRGICVGPVAQTRCLSLQTGDADADADGTATNVSQVSSTSDISRRGQVFQAETIGNKSGSDRTSGVVRRSIVVNRMSRGWSSAWLDQVNIYTHGEEKIFFR